MNAPPDSPVPLSTADRLDSWKAISHHLRRDIRTVQRWEAQGLPVYRLQHLKHGSVYAYRSEIDLWWTSRQPRTQHRAISKFTSVKLRFLRPCLYTALGVAIALSGLMGRRILSARKTERVAPSTARIFNLAVFPFEEPSQDPRDAGLAREFMQSLVRNLKLQHSLRVLDAPGMYAAHESASDLKYLVNTLHADDAISASVLRANGGTRITARLIDARNGKVLWTTQFEQETANEASFQSSVARAVALDVENALSVKAQ